MGIDYSKPSNSSIISLCLLLLGWHCHEWACLRTKRIKHIQKWSHMTSA